MAIWETEYTEPFHHATYPAISPTRPELSASGKVVVISGGGRGLGIKMVESFAQAGASQVFIVGRNASALEAVAADTKAAYPATEVHTVAGDVSSEQDMVHLFSEVKRLAPGGIDVLFANAGYLPTVTPIAAATADTKADSAVTADWWSAFEINAKGTYLLARHFLAAARSEAVFVNVTAAGAHLNPSLLGFSAYSASKLGTARMVETLQAENKELRFYNVHPGCVKTDMMTKSGLEALGDAMAFDEGEYPSYSLLVEL